MTHAEAAIKAIQDGAEYLPDIAHAMNASMSAASSVLFLAAREGVVHREYNRYRGMCRYRMPDDTELLKERRERVERMMEWSGRWGSTARRCKCGEYISV